MKPGRFLVPSSEDFSTKKRIVKKLFATVLATVALSTATLNAAGDLHSASYDRTEDDVITSVRPGLSRTRPAFRKAISMLAEAAPADERLADYYDRVTKRVKGDEADGENNPGAGVVKSEGDDSQSGAEGGPSAQQQFTVGDMAFDTNPAIEQWMTYYTATPVGRRTLKIGIERSSSYLEMARAEFRSAGVPEDLVWLAFVESVWNPRSHPQPRAASGSSCRQPQPNMGSRFKAETTSALTRSSRHVSRLYTFATFTQYSATGRSRWPPTTPASPESWAQS